MESHDFIELRTNHGIVGDRKAREASRGQVTIVSVEQLAQAGEVLGKTIGPGVTRRNVTIAGLELRPEIGLRLRLGEALLEVSGDCAPCELMDEVLGPGAMDALRHDRSGVRARVLEGGRLSVGDAVRVEAASAT